MSGSSRSLVHQGGQTTRPIDSSSVESPIEKGSKLFSAFNRVDEIIVALDEFNSAICNTPCPEREERPGYISLFSLLDETDVHISDKIDLCLSKIATLRNLVI